MSKYELDSFEATSEQIDIVDAAKEGKSFKVMALSGTGKTSTARLIAKYHKRKTVYVCFNKTIADKASSEMPSHVDSRTLNSLAYRGVSRKGFKFNLKPSLYLRDITNVLKCSYPDAEAVREILSFFCISDDDGFNFKHCKGEAFQEVIKKLPDEKRKLKQNYLLGLAGDYWEAAWQKKPSQTIYITHDFYVKYFELHNPVIDAELIIVDEAQDMNPVASSIILKQKHAQVIWIGDNNQQLYKWRGSTNHLEKLKIPEYGLTVSFRFGQKVADIANYVLSSLGSKYLLKGKGGPSKVILDKKPESLDGFTVLGRTNTGLLIEAIKQIKKGKRVYLPSYGDSKRALWAGFYIMNGEPSKVSYASFKGVENWEELKALADTEAEAEMVVKFLTADDGNLTKALNRFESHHVSSPKDADVSFYTVHKAKGEEWDKVFLLPEFNDLKYFQGDTIHTENANLLYVALTRGKKEVWAGSEAIEKILGED